jgi:hypothetical protein
VLAGELLHVAYGECVGVTRFVRWAGRPDLRRRVCSTMDLQLVSGTTATFLPPGQVTWGGNYRVQLSLGYLFYSDYLVLGNFFPSEGCFPPVLLQ